MADESENIEARLAAYIDGEMAPGERADIEQYLAANPSHAKLIAELREQRGQLGALPREKAPVEIMDHLQQHLERHALLDDSQDGDVGSMRVNRWPQLTAAAAMLLLAAGLGLLVYQVLPGGGRGEQVVLAPGVRENLSKLPSVDEAPATEKADGDLRDTLKDKGANDKALADTAGATPPAAANQLNQNDSNQTMQNQMASNSGMQNSVQRDDQSLAKSANAQQLENSAGSSAFRTTAPVADAKDSTTAPGVVSTGAVAAADRPKDFVEEMADRMVKRQMAAAKDGALAAPHATLSVVSDDPTLSGALVAEYLVQNGYSFDTAKAPATAPSTQPALPTLILHNVSPERARQVQIALNDQRSGRQQASLEFARRAAATITTQPAKTEAQAIDDTEKALAAEPAAVPNAPIVGIAPPKAAVAATEPTTRNTDQFDAAAAALPAREEAGDLWIVIEAAPPAPAAPATTAPATTEPAEAAPVVTPPTTLPATLPAPPIQ